MKCFPLKFVKLGLRLGVTARAPVHGCRHQSWDRDGNSRHSSDERHPMFHEKWRNMIEHGRVLLILGIVISTLPQLPTSKLSDWLVGTRFERRNDDFGENDGRPVRSSMSTSPETSGRPGRSRCRRPKPPVALPSLFYTKRACTTTG